MADSSILLKQFDGSNYSQYFPQNLPLDIANQFVNSKGKNSNDIFNYLRKYCQYWWRKYFNGQVTEYSEKQSNLSQTEEVYNESYDDYGQSVIPSPFVIKYSKEININSNGVSLKNPVTKTFSFSQSNDDWPLECENLLKRFLEENCPCYVLFPRTTPVYYLPERSTSGHHSGVLSADFSNVSSSDYYYFTITLGGKTQQVSYTTNTYNKIETQYVNSINQSQYPDGEKIDNWLYTYLGIPFENMIDPLKCQYGTYTGTGKYGDTNSNSLTFSFQPSFLIINDGSYCIFCGTMGTLIGFGYNRITIEENTSWDKNTVTWYCSSSVRQAEYQMNSSGETYYYFAIK